MRRSRLGWLSAMAIVVAGCGGDEVAAPVSTSTTALPTTTVVVTTTTSASTTTTMPPTTTVPPTTTAPPATTMVEVPGRGLMPATVIAPTDEPVDEATKAAILEAVLAHHSAWNLCTSDPENCDVDTLGRPGGTAHALAGQFMRRLAQAGYRGRNGGEDRFQPISWTRNTNGSIDLVGCGVDAGVIYDPRGTEDPSDDVIIDGRVASVTTIWNFVEVNGRWELDSTVHLGEEEGDKCPR